MIRLSVLGRNLLSNKILDLNKMKDTSNCMRSPSTVILPLLQPILLALREFLITFIQEEDNKSSTGFKMILHDLLAYRHMIASL